MIVADVDAKGADDTVSQIRAAGRQGRFVHTDVGSGGLTPLGQYEIFERRRIAERNQDGAAQCHLVPRGGQEPPGEVVIVVVPLGLYGE